MAPTRVCALVAGCNEYVTSHETSMSRMHLFIFKQRTTLSRSLIATNTSQQLLSAPQTSLRAGEISLRAGEASPTAGKAFLMAGEAFLGAGESFSQGRKGFPHGQRDFSQCLRVHVRIWA